jgi:hypothetical protein
VASPWIVEITPTAGAGLERLVEEYGEDAYRDALRDIIARKKIQLRMERSTCARPEPTIASICTVHSIGPSTVSPLAGGR